MAMIGLFDCDGTLFDNRPVQPFAEQQDWLRVAERIDLIVPCQTAEGESALALTHCFRQWAVVSSSPRWYIWHLCRKFRVRPWCVIGCDDVVDTKPHPEALKLAVAAMRVSVARCMMIGDDEADRAAAETVQMRFGRVAWSKCDSISGVRGDVTIAGPLELAAIVRNGHAG